MNDQALWVEGTTELEGAAVRYRSRGEGPTLVFVHGVYIGGSVWEPLAELLDGYRCVLPTWLLGAHRDPAPNADLSARTSAKRIPALLEALDLADVTLVGNDTGGGLCLASLATDHPGLARISRLVLTNCDSYEHFPPKGFDRIVAISRKAPFLATPLLRFFATKAGQKFFMKTVCVNPPPTQQAVRYFEAFATSSQARHDALRVTQSLESSVTLEAVGALKSFDKPVLLAWGDSDKTFPLDHARRLQQDFPHAQLEVIPRASLFVMLDQPDLLAQAIRDFTKTSTQPS
jgi:pimeloyl-ACP methyl ester carboxylesterase